MSSLHQSGLHAHLARALRGRAVRASLTAAGVALCALLTVVLFAAQRSLTAAVDTYPGAAGADLWVLPRGTDNLIRSTTVLPESFAERARSLPGVAAADPVLRAFLTFESVAGDRRATLLAIGYRIPDGVGGPPALREGRLPQHWDEIVLDRAAAARLGVTTGGALRVNRSLLKVTGLTQGTNLLATQLAFGDVRAAARAAGLEGRVSSIAVRTAPGVLAAQLGRQLESRLEGASVQTTRSFVASNLREVSAGVRPLLALLVSLGLAVAAVLVALLAQGQAEDAREDVAVLLALGAAPETVGSALMRQVAALITAAALGGATLGAVLASVLDRWAPTVALAPRLADALVTLGLFLGAGAAGAVLPLARLRRVDPLEAFRS